MKPIAFYKWLALNLDNDRVLIANYLRTLVLDGPNDSEIWSLLEQTGDTAYTSETFLKCADLVIKGAKE